ncbi:MAG TPA: hypothetical protein VGZ27_00955 [Vicinamibacterales bacterium]|jgi:hypothetical protein|nr:hypothetical protein [Vicinamibacterales bacterium]
MRRTSIACLNPDLTSGTAARQTLPVPQLELRLRWAFRNGRLSSHWGLEHHDPAEGGARSASRTAA